MSRVEIVDDCLKDKVEFLMVSPSAKLMTGALKLLSPLSASVLLTVARDTDNCPRGLSLLTCTMKEARSLSSCP